MSASCQTSRCDASSSTALAVGGYGVVMCLAGLVAMVLSWWLADQTGVEAVPGVVGIVVLAAAISLLPVFVSSAGRFGLVVMGVSVGRLLIVLSGGLILSEVLGLPSKAVWLPLALCALVLLLAESLAAIVVLKRAQHAQVPRAEARSSGSYVASSSSVVSSCCPTQESSAPC